MIYEINDGFIDKYMIMTIMLISTQNALILNP
jgi:hypothetical protein